MDENSCENETSESADGQKAKETEDVSQLESAGIALPFKSTKKSKPLSSGSGTSFDPSVSGPSKVFVGPKNVKKPQVESTSNATEPVENAMERTDIVPQNDMERTDIVPQNDMERTDIVAQNAMERTDIVPQNDMERTDIVPQNAEELEPASETKGENKKFTEQTPEADNREETSLIPQSALPCYDERQESQPRVRLAPGVEEQLANRRPSVGPPPSYSFVMKQKKKVKPVTSLEPLTTAVSPPPRYDSPDMFLTSEERICNLPSLADPIWRSHSQPALCPRCGILVLTTTHTHDSLATHMAALALCLFGCWPCCLLPYCMNVCKNTSHHCPICQAFLGLYKPW